MVFLRAVDSEATNGKPMGEDTVLKEPALKAIAKWSDTEDRPHVDLEAMQANYQVEIGLGEFYMTLRFQSEVGEVIKAEIAYMNDQGFNIIDTERRGRSYSMYIPAGYEQSLVALELTKFFEKLGLRVRVIDRRETPTKTPKQSVWQWISKAFQWFQ